MNRRISEKKLLCAVSWQGKDGVRQGAAGFVWEAAALIRVPCRLVDFYHTI
jgi:hypothetical protein